MLAERNWAQVVAIQPEYQKAPGFQEARGEGYLNRLIAGPSSPTQGRWEGCSTIASESVLKRHQSGMYSPMSPSNASTNATTHGGSLRSALTIADQALSPTIDVGRVLEFVPGGGRPCPDESRPRRPSSSSRSPAGVRSVGRPRRTTSHSSLAWCVWYGHKRSPASSSYMLPPRISAPMRDPTQASLLRHPGRSSARSHWLPLRLKTFMTRDETRRHLSVRRRTATDGSPMRNTSWPVVTGLPSYGATWSRNQASS